MEHKAASARRSRLLAGLLLAGTVLAAPLAFAQEPAAEPLPADPAVAVTGPLAPPTEEDAVLGPVADSREGLRLNIPENPIEGDGRQRGNTDATGIRLGSFILKPSISQGLGSERTASGGTSTSRTFWRTGIRGSLVSDWSRHELAIEAAGIHERNIGGTGEEDPSARIDADLRLDLADDTIARLTAGYDFERESSTDPDAVAGASVQSGVHGFSGGARITRDFGLIRGTVGAAVRREVYGSARLANGNTLSLSDRDNTEATLTARIGYEISPALIPYLEASAGRALYDERRDSLGYERSSNTIGGRAGLEVDLGEKLRGDIGFGYKRTRLDDARLAAIGAATVDGSIFWSPQRGTDLRLGLSTTIEPTTTAGASGYVSYETTAELTHELRENLVARLSGAYEWNDLPAAIGPDRHVYSIGAGLTWDINRWLSLTGDVSYELTRQARAADTGVTRAGIGLVLRR